MNPEQKEKLLKLALRLFGVIFILVYPIGIVWPSGWIWHGGESERGHLVGDVPALLLVAVVLGLLSSRKQSEAPS